MKERKKCQKNEPSPTLMRQMVLEIFHFKSEIWTSPFCRFSASFSLEYNVKDAMLQDNEEMKVQYLRSLLFDLFETLLLLELSKGFSLDFKFRCYGNQHQSHGLLLKKTVV